MTVRMPESDRPFGADISMLIPVSEEMLGALFCVVQVESGTTDDYIIPFIPGVPAIPDFPQPPSEPHDAPLPFVPFWAEPEPLSAPESEPDAEPESIPDPDPKSDSMPESPEALADLLGQK